MSVHDTRIGVLPLVEVKDCIVACVLQYSPHWPLADWSEENTVASRNEVKLCFTVLELRSGRVLRATLDKTLFKGLGLVWSRTGCSHHPEWLGLRRHSSDNTK